MKAILRSGFLVLSIMLALAAPAKAGPFEDGLVAAERGDYAAALKFWLPLAEQGDAKLQVTVGLLYEKGLGVPQDFVRAHMWFILAAAQDNEEAKQGRDRTASLMAPDQIAAAQTNLAYMYENGRGVPKDYAEAVKWYRMAAGQGHAVAQNSLGFMYDIGQGVPQDYAEAAKWYRRAAEQGYVYAQSNLGVMYRGGLGVSRDDAEAVKWWLLAAEQGNAKAQYNLGNRYANGQGVQQDNILAYLWFNLAAVQGHKNAQINEDIAASLLTPDQIVEAQRMAREWMEKYQR